MRSSSSRKEWLHEEEIIKNTEDAPKETVKRDSLGEMKVRAGIKAGLLAPGVVPGFGNVNSNGTTLSIGP